MNFKSMIRCIKRVLALTALTFIFSAHAALVGRDLDGNLATIEAVYDDVLDITWLADANLAASNTFGVSGIQPASSTNPTRYPAGKMHWDTAQDFVNAMNANSYLGVSTWRQASASGACIGQYRCGDQESDTADELGYHYSQNFGTDGQDVDPFYYGFPNSTTDTTALAMFSNIQSNYYWTGTETPDSTNHAIYYRFNQGFQTSAWKGNVYYVWAVASGDVGVSVVPVPTAIWLFASTLLGVAGLKQKEKLNS